MCDFSLTGTRGLLVGCCPPVVSLNRRRQHCILTVSEALFLQRTARCRAVMPSLVLKSRWAPPQRRTLMSSQLSSSWTARVRGHSETHGHRESETHLIHFNTNIHPVSYSVRNVLWSAPPVSESWKFGSRPFSSHLETFSTFFWWTCSIKRLRLAWKTWQQLSQCSEWGEVVTNFEFENWVCTLFWLHISTLVCNLANCLSST